MTKHCYACGQTVCKCNCPCVGTEQANPDNTPGKICSECGFCTCGEQVEEREFPIGCWNCDEVGEDAE